MTSDSSLRSNNLDVLRILFAYLVVVCHIAALYGYTNLTFPFNQSGLGVGGFFVISGFLMAWSLDRQPALRGYAIKRLCRIYPIYVVAIVVQTILLAIHLSGSTATCAKELGWYFVANAAFANFLKPTVGGIFAHLPMQAVNGSLWTLKVEIVFYLLVPILLALRKLCGSWILGALYVFSVLYYATAPGSEIAVQLPGQIRFFVVGMSLFLLRDRFTARRPLVLVVGVAGISLWEVAHCANSVPHVIEVSVLPLIIGTFVFAVAFCLPVIKMSTDVSYGVYLWHYPLIQFFLHHRIAVNAFGLFFVVTLVGSTVVAWLGYILVERPWIAMGNRWVSRTLGRESGRPTRRLEQAGQEPVAS